ncbi:UDP-glucose 4-epimerase [hydrothermal vent metagenome]|uniref:UDP-glucose 4-epimerase n=1 Tax=hydrothermal vent metagenome TaxID=652676 RepID=A0A3B0XGK4_9ZZZZ
MKVLVVGGAGYIGSHMVKMLSKAGHDVSTLDNLSNGYKDAVKYGEFIEGDIADTTLLNRLFSENRFDGVMHFASYIQVGESVEKPSMYYRNNVSNTQVLLDAMIEHNIKHFIFSSTAATFGEPQYTPIDEKHPQKPINPYGHSKLMVEQILADFDYAYGLKSVSLRYFNAAGADPQGELGERHIPETHLLPLVLQAASGRRDSIMIFGTDYDTPDGTCVRDYIHINDLCSAHLLGLEHLLAGGESRAYNMGNGQGYSIKEVIDVAKKVTGADFAVKLGERREGDPARLVADASLLQKELGWKPEYAELEIIVRHAWEWEEKYSEWGESRKS